MPVAPFLFPNLRNFRSREGHPGTCRAIVRNDSRGTFALSTRHSSLRLDLLCSFGFFECLDPGLNIVLWLLCFLRLRKQGEPLHLQAWAMEMSECLSSISHAVVLLLSLDCFCSGFAANENHSKTRVIHALSRCFLSNHAAIAEPRELSSCLSRTLQSMA